MLLPVPIHSIKRVGVNKSILKRVRTCDANKSIDDRGVLSRGKLNRQSQANIERILD